MYAMSWRSSSSLFQSTRPRGARRASGMVAQGLVTFQSTRPRGARRFENPEAERCYMFQSTRPRGARQGESGTCAASYGFNPRARVGRDRPHRQPRTLGNVSIHAPAWGATTGPRQNHRARRVSIHAPAWGATADVARSVPARCCVAVSANLSRTGRNPGRVRGKASHNILGNRGKASSANIVLGRVPLGVRAQTIRLSLSTSKVGLAPMCSTRFCHSLPME